MILDTTNQYIFTMIETSESSSDVEPFITKKVEISIADNPALDEILASFEDFLLANGFRLNENESLAIVKQIEENPENENESDS